MANFSTNQVQQLYVAKSLDTTMTTASTVGAINAVGTTDDIYFQYQGNAGLVRSDLVNKDQIISAVGKSYLGLQRGLKKDTIALNANVNSGAPVAGQDYLLRTTFFDWGAPSTENQLYKYGFVRATTGMTAEKFYQQMYASLVFNFSRDAIPLLSFSLTGTYAAVTMTTNTGVTATANTLGTAGNDISIAIASVSAGAAGVVVTGTDIVVSLTAAAKTIADLKAAILADSDAAALVTITGTDATTVLLEATPVALTGGTTTGIIAEELEQPWRLGIKSSDALHYQIVSDQILSGGAYVTWGTVTSTTPTTILGDGKPTADREYFFLGERGDVYRGTGFPNNFTPTYLVDETIEYCYIDIVYYYVGDNEAVQKSQKSITLVVPAVGTTNADKIALTNTIIADINTAHGTTLIASIT